MPSLDVFNQDAFGVISLTDAVNKIPFIPGQIGQMGLFQENGVSTLTVMIEEQEGSLALIPIRPRGGEPNINRHNRRTVRALTIPHLPLEDQINADEVQGVRAFGSETAVQSVQQIANDRFAEMSGKLDATLEHMRVGTIKGTVLDADGSTFLDLFSAFNVSALAEIDFDLDNATPAKGAVRKNCHLAIRRTRDELGGLPFRSIWGICGSAFFDDLVSHGEVAAAYERWAGNPMQSAANIAAAVGQPGDFLRMSLVERSVEYAGIYFQEYRGEVSGQKFVDDDKCHIFPVGVPGLFRTVYGPADFMETVNTVGRPRYAKMVPDPSNMNRFEKLHLQSNPLNYCTRPRVLQLAKRT